MFGAEDKLQNIIRQFISLDPATGTGWHPVLCKVCNDKGHKGKRAGFRFDGDAVAYHCFNCGHSTVYDPTSHTNIPKKMVQVLDDFGVPQSEWQAVVLASLSNANKQLSPTSKKTKNFEPQPIDIPDYFYSLHDCEPNDKWATIAKYYLEDRLVNPNDYPFMLSKKTNNPASAKWVGRIIIPIYKNNTPIFYIGRDLTGNKTKKYESPSVSRTNVLYGFDLLFDMDEKPIYIVEGWFDAFVIGGVAVLGNEISEGQAYWLNRSRKKKVYIPDRYGNGKRGAIQALKHGWSVSTPDIGDCKDISEAVQKYGKLYVLKTIAAHTASGFEAEMKIGVYCEK